tara:strand:+ start:2001 stop:2618 length:618 start_codon:yes stop_codon:yes gene_type:complete
MPKPNEKFTVAQMKDYIRNHSLNKTIRLTQKKADLISSLKKEGHWESGSAKKATPKKATPKPSPKKYIPPKARKSVKPAMDKSGFMDALNIMAMVGKSKGYSTKENIDDQVKWQREKEAVKKRGIKVGGEISLGKEVKDKFGKLLMKDVWPSIVFDVVTNMNNEEDYEDLGSISLEDVKVNKRGIVTGRKNKVYNTSTTWSELMG